MEKIRTEDLKQPDLFVSEVSIVWKWAHKHQKILGIIIGVAILAGVGVSFFEWFDGSREQKAQESLFVAMNKYEKVREAFEKGEKPPKDSSKDQKNVNAKKDGAQKEEEPEEPESPVAAMKATGDFDKDYGDAAKEFLTVIQKQKGTRASIIAALSLAQIYKEYKKSEEGLKLMTEISSSIPNHSVLKGGVILNLGDFHQLKGDCPKAISEWEKINNDTKLTFVKPEALLRQALCHKSMGQSDKASEIFKKLSSDQDLSTSRAGQAAKKYMRM